MCKITDGLFLWKLICFSILCAVLINYPASLPVLVPLAFILSLAHSRLYALSYLFFIIKYMYKPIKLCDSVNSFEMMHFTDVGHTHECVWKQFFGHSAFLNFCSLSVLQRNQCVFKLRGRSETFILAFTSTVWLWFVDLISSVTKNIPQSNFSFII